MRIHPTTRLVWSGQSVWTNSKRPSAVDCVLKCSVAVQTDNVGKIWTRGSEMEMEIVGYLSL